MRIIGVVSGDERFIQEVRTAAAGAGFMAARKVQHFAALLKTKVKAHASGRPGPNAPTGDYRRSITHEYGYDLGVYYAEVGTNAPQGRRLEFGFNGQDSLGRSYNQPPYPHFGPAVDEIEPLFLDALGEVFGP